MTLLLRTWLLGCGLAACVVFNPQSTAIQRAHFPTPGGADAVPLTSPAFAKARGFTTHDELTAFLDGLAAAHEEATVSSIGTSQRGRSIPMIRLTGADPTLRVFFQGGLHGNEPAGTEGLLLLVQRLLTDPDARGLLDQIDLAVIPVANPDGFERQVRAAANGLDLNRDQTKLQIHESPLLKQAFHAFEPHVAVDFHEYRPYRRDFSWFGTQGISHAYDVMFLYSGNLNVPEPLRSLTADVFVPDLERAMQAHGLRHHDYVTTRDVDGDIWFNQGSVQSRSSATHFALAHTVSLLVEVRGVALGRSGFERRALSTLWVAEQVLRTAASDPARVRRALDASVGVPAEVAVLHEPAVGADQIQVIDLASQELVDIDVTVRDNLRSTASLRRARPAAYAVMPGQEALVERLGWLGLDTLVLDAGREVSAERYQVASVSRSPFPYEGQTTQDAVVDITVDEVRLPAGTVLVPMDRPGANLAIEVFEPESPNSFVSFGVLRARPGTVLPIVRVMDGADSLLSQP